MLVQLSGVLDGSQPDHQVKFNFERGLLQAIIDKQTILKKNAPLQQQTQPSKKFRTSYFQPASISLTLVSVKTCDVATHQHFKPPEEANYPTAENYQQFVIVSRKEITGETETESFVESPEEPTERRVRRAAEEEQAAPEVSRQFSAPPTWDLNNAEQQISYKAYLNAVSGLGSISRSSITTLKSLGQALSNLVADSLGKPFNRWQKHQISIELMGYAADGTTSVSDLAQAKKGRIKVTLPPYSKLTTTTVDVWTSLGFVANDVLSPDSCYQTQISDLIVKELPSIPASGFDNTASDQTRVFQSKHAFVLDQNYASSVPSKNFLFKFTSKKSCVSKKIIFPSGLLPSGHAVIPSTVFRQLFSNIMEELQLKDVCIEVGTEINGTPYQGKFALRIPTDGPVTADASSAFPLTIEFNLSEKLVQVLNIEVTNYTPGVRKNLVFRWQPDKGTMFINVRGTARDRAPATLLRDLKAAIKAGATKNLDWTALTSKEGYTRQSANPEEDPDQVAKKKKEEREKKEKQDKIDGIQSLIETSNVEQRYKEAQKLLTKMETTTKDHKTTYSTSMPNLLVSLTAIETLLADAKAKNTREALQLTKLDQLKTGLTISTADADLESTKKSISNEIVTIQRLLTTQEAQLSVIEKKLNDFSTVEVVKESTKLAQEKIAKAAADAAAAAEAAAITTTTTNTPAITTATITTSSVETIVSSVAALAPGTTSILNPSHPRGDKYIVFNSNGGQELCTTDATFPTDYLLLVDEGEPLDFISNRGFCSILAYIKNSGSKIINNNQCIISNPTNIASLHLRLITAGLGEYKPAKDKKIFISLVVKLSTLAEDKN